MAEQLMARLNEAAKSGDLQRVKDALAATTSEDDMPGPMCEENELTSALLQAAGAEADKAAQLVGEPLTAATISALAERPQVDRESMRVGAASTPQTPHSVCGKSASLMVGLPITSKGLSEEEALQRLRDLAQGLPAEAHCYVAVDRDDAVYAHRDTAWLESLLGRPCSLTMLEARAPGEVFPICKVYNMLVRTAFCDGKDYFVLLGDDVRLSTNTWFPAVVQAFRDMQGSALVSTFGFGVVAIHDETAPGFPTFPIVHRTHVEHFKGEFCPPDFVNQDADPWVWEVYRRFAATAFLEKSHVSLYNAVGGTDGTPRYERLHLDGWKDRVLQQSVERVRQRNQVPISTLTNCIDVVVPTFRLILPMLEGIVKLKTPALTSTLFIIIVDNPDSPNVAAVKELERRYAPHVRVRVQPRNMGVVAARNRGIEESAADWILFLDDDVESSKSCLYEYTRSVRSFGSVSSGFVGPTTFPPPETRRSRAVQLSGITFFWALAADSGWPWHMQGNDASPAAIPWGVTANVMLRRLAGVRFRPGFPATGGGEDIAMCLDTAERAGLPLRVCPKGHARHPWWENGRFSSWRFFSWTQGDGLLIDLYPNLAFYAPPNIIELTAAGALLGALAAMTLTPSHVKAVAGWVAWAWACEFVADGVQHACEGDISADSLCGAGSGFGKRGWLGELQAALLSTVIKNHVELGHLWVHLKRGRVGNLCRRFDWFCGYHPQFVPVERRRAAVRLLFFCAPVLVAAARYAF